MPVGLATSVCVKGEFLFHAKDTRILQIYQSCKDQKIAYAFFANKN
jgi:hypothetical protein